MPIPHSSPLPDFKPAIGYAVEKWNCGPGAAFGATIDLDPAAIARHPEWEVPLFDGINLPRQPGPFKRVAAFAILSQYASPFRWKYDASRTDLNPDDLRWQPRATVWTLPFLASVLRLGGQPLTVDFKFPTPHYQLEFIAYLRNLRKSVQHGKPIDFAELTERVVLLSLAIEGASYGSASQWPALANFVSHAGACVSGDRLDDLLFNSEAFLTCATSIGVN